MAVSHAPVLAAERYSIALPAGDLAQSLETLSRQTGIAIGGVELGPAGIRSPALKGHLTVREALSRLLAGTPFVARFVSPGAVRIVRRRASPSKAPPPLPAPPMPPLAPPSVDEIVVIGSKRRTALIDYPGTAHVLDMEAGNAISGTRGLEGALEKLPTSAFTSLGPGRDKLFLRGIADSSFNGPTQSTVGVYLGEVRLIYSAPNPDLRLYDIGRVEIIEGPQGTLYGAGSLGGVLRIVPNEAQLDGFHMRIWGGVAAVADGGTSHDRAGMVNVPLARFAAVRILGYQQRDDGYIDDAARGLVDVNSARIDGWRGILRIAPGDNWYLDLGAGMQILETDDSQYAERGRPALTRASAIAQPYDLDIEHYSATLSKTWGALELISATGIVRNDIDTRFDASRLSPEGGILAFDESRRIRLFSHETRLSLKRSSGVSAVVGLSFLTNEDETERLLGPPGASEEIGRAVTKTREMAAFGEASLPLFRVLTGTMGARLVQTRVAGERETASGVEIEPIRESLRVLPTAALSWRWSEDALAHIRYHKGYRPGGISIGDGATPQIERFRADSLHTVEGGIRIGLENTRPLSVFGTLFYTRWRNIQSDLIDTRGFPRTTNIGDGEVYGMTASASWRPTPPLRLDASVFLNENELTRPAASFSVGEQRSLPNIPKVSIRGAAQFEAPISSTIDLKLQLQLAYFGKSNLGLDPFLNVEQGDYFRLDSGVSAVAAKWRVDFGVTNIFNARANRFSLGNPFSVIEERQITPERPRTVRLGMTLGF